MAVWVARRRAPALEPDPEAINLIIPCGIGDASWIYSKVKHFPSIFGREVRLAMPDAQPRRGHQLIERLPGVSWAGYDSSQTHEEVFRQALPGNARQEAFVPGRWIALECNHWLEWGKPLANFLPWCPTDYHYDFPFTMGDRQVPLPTESHVWAVYVSNRDKENYPGWALWPAKDWAALLDELPGSFVFLGADYDADKTNDVYSLMAERGRTVSLCLGRPFGEAMWALSKADRFLAFPSGIGIMANVFNVPGVMLLPKHLEGLERSYADPATTDYRAWANPTTAEVLDWLRGEGLA